MRHRRTEAADRASPFALARAILGGPKKPTETPQVEKRLADVSVLDELVSLDLHLAKRQHERIETAYAEDRVPAPADVSLYAAATTSARASVAEKAKILGTYGGSGGPIDKNKEPSFRVYVSDGKLPAETGADDAEDPAPSLPA
jgi:hypothetical protein